MGNDIRPKPILILQQLECEPPALLQDIFIEQGWRCHSIMTQTQALPRKLDEFSGLVVMGGPQSARDHHLPQIAQQIALLQQAIDRDFPVLGICLGAQLLAHAAGSDILISPLRELGWFPIYPTNHAGDDPLFCTLPANGLNIFQWHGETFNLPADAKLLATSPDVCHQAFRIGSSQYGLQFHIEVNETIIRTWIDMGESERNHLGKEGLESIFANCPQHLPIMYGFCRKLATAWLNSLKSTVR